VARERASNESAEVYVKSPAAQSMRTTTLAAGMSLSPRKYAGEHGVLLGCRVVVC